jgi:hypothetical protein
MINKAIIIIINLTFDTQSWESLDANRFVKRTFIEQTFIERTFIEQTFNEKLSLLLNRATREPHGQHVSINPDIATSRASWNKQPSYPTTTTHTSANFYQNQQKERTFRQRNEL